MKLPAVHCALTAMHALPPSVDVYVAPASHAAHWRSAVAEPGADMPSPAAHVVHGEHALRPGEAVKVPCAHSVHTRSLEVVASELVYLPLLQTGLAVVHAPSLSPMEYVEPATHAEHWRSAEVVPSMA